MLKKCACFTLEPCEDNTENGVTICRCILSWGLSLRSSVHYLVLKPQEACYKKESLFSKRQSTKRTEFFPTAKNSVLAISSEIFDPNV